MMHFHKAIGSECRGLCRDTGVCDLDVWTGYKRVEPGSAETWRASRTALFASYSPSGEE